MSNFDLLTEEESALADHACRAMTWVQGSWQVHKVRAGTNFYRSTNAKEEQRLKFVKSLMVAREAIDELIMRMDPYKAALDPDALIARRK